MKTLFIPCAIACLVSITSLLGADSSWRPSKVASAPVDPSKTPEGLAPSDWSSIRAAYEHDRHAIVANPDGTHQARNPGQAWLTKFDRRGFTVTPDSGDWSWGLELVGYGETTDVRLEGGKISYVRDNGLTEWFVNDGRGLEQGWTLARRPDRTPVAGPIRLQLDVRGGLRPQVSAAGNSVAFLNKSDGVALTYGGLKAWDADGETVPVYFAKAGSAGLGVMVDDAAARYPITIDPIAQQQAYLKASNTGADDSFGGAVAVSGNTVVVGALHEDSSATGINGNEADNSVSNSGAAYVFVRNGTTWSQQAYLKASNARFNDGFGKSVAVSGDTVVVGAYGESSNTTGVNGNQADNSATYAGAAYVFVRNGSAWSQQAYLKASNTSSNDFFGGTIAVSGDTVVVGAYGEDSGATEVNGNQSDNSATYAGAAYVFVRNGTTWSQQAYLKASNAGFNDFFGNSIAVSGNTVVVGAYWEASNATGVNGNETNNTAETFGAAYVFVRNGTTWSQQAYLKASNSENGDLFGISVAVSGDTVVVGATGESSNAIGVNGNHGNNSAPGAGAAYVFVRSGSFWSQEAYLKASNTEASDYFGESVAVSGDTVLVGAPNEASNAIGVNGNEANNSTSHAGAVYLFVRSGTIWSQQAYIKASNTEFNDEFGQSIAISGATVVVGAHQEDSNATGVDNIQGNNSNSASGAVYVFDPGSRTLFTTAVNGLVSGNGDYILGATASLTASPTSGYLFVGWTGDATGTDNPLSVVMDSDKTITATFTPDTRDDDNDGLTNYQEIVVYGTNPALPDTDGDEVKDSLDAFPFDPTEALDTDHDGIGDNADLDDDGDGFSDADEINTYGTNPKLADSDGDGLSDPNELQIHLTNPNLADTDGDELSDGAEFLTHHTNPKIGDTDGDGFLDGYEVLTGKSPLNILDKPALVAEARTAIEFTFPTALGKTYRIEESLDLTTWGIVESGIAGNGGQIQRFYSTRNVPKRYFRVEEYAQ